MFVEKIIRINIIKSLWFSIRFCGWAKGVKLPLVLAYGMKIRIDKSAQVLLPDSGRVIFRGKGSWRMNAGSTIVFKGITRIDSGIRIFVNEKSSLILGNRFMTNGTCVFNVGKKMVFGDNVLFSDNSLIYDTDYHSIYDENGSVINYNRDVIVGNNVWFGNRTIILKGTTIGDNVVIGSGSVISGKLLESNAIYAGVPAKLIKKGITWDNNYPGN